MSFSFQFPAQPEKYTAVLRQYLEHRAKTDDALLFFRLGDFYECFFTDAEIIAKELEITLTARSDSAHEGGKVPMAGVPHKSAEASIAKLLKAGFKVALCEQIGETDGKGPMKRELIRILTPGTLLETEFLESEKANYLAAICPPEKDNKAWGLAFVDISTGNLKITELSENELSLELTALKPSELLVASSRIKDLHGIEIERALLPAGLNKQDFSITNRALNLFDLERATNKIKQKFGAFAIEGFGCQDYKTSLQALGVVLDYLEFTYPESMKALSNVQVYQINSFLQFDAQVAKHLELFENMRNRNSKGTLISVLEENIKTKMGIRLLRNWLAKPLMNVNEIQNRQDKIENLTLKPHLLNNLAGLLSQITDLERLGIKLKTNRLNPREMGFIKKSLLLLPALKALLEEVSEFNIDFNYSDNLLLKVREIEQALLDELPINSSDGSIFRIGYSEKLDELKNIVEQNENWLARYEIKERENSGIKSLKVCFNKAAGFYIEITKTNRNLVPANYKIKQNLTNIDRYITDELREHETKFLLAENSLKSLEQELFNFLRDSLNIYCDEILVLAAQLAETDCLAGLANLALKNNYIKPEINNSKNFKIKEGRHPVIEKLLPNGYFVNNDLNFDQESELMIILTGPNMSGKSTFMRQNALLCLMAQMGSFIPAAEAEIGLIDKIFTRIGASDDLSQGQSTFMVEMTETAYLLNNMTEKSLLLLDEIGRGTSTYDGVAIAWSLAEYIAQKESRCIFATHYHELNSLEDNFQKVINYQVSVHEGEDELVFLHKVIAGGADRSYGIEVARMAGLPKQVLNRAKNIMNQMNTKGLPNKRKDLIQESIAQSRIEFVY